MPYPRPGARNTEIDTSQRLSVPKGDGSIKTPRLASVAAVLAKTAAFAVKIPGACGAWIYFSNLGYGLVVTTAATVQFGQKGMGVTPAATVAELPGHHHLLINRPQLGEGEDEIEHGLPSDENHLHFGKGQTEATIDLPAGKYTLQLVL